MTVRPRKAIEEAHAYEEEAHVPFNLMANTNLFPPNPALSRAPEAARDLLYRDYPSLTSRSLREVAARHYGVNPAGVVTGNGSNELLDVVIRTYADVGDAVAFHPPTFSMIPAFIQGAGARPAPVPLDRERGWRLDVDGLVATGAKVTFVVTPNNPTGNAFPREEVRRVVEETDGIVVVDEAYHEFTGEPSFADALDEHPNLVVLRTLSKAHGLAALRIGFALANPDVARELSKVRGPFRLNAFSEAVGCLALDNEDYEQEVAARVREMRPRFSEMLEAHGFFVFPSDANFVLAEPPVDAGALAARLLDEGVAVRAFGEPLSRFVRITIGPDAALAALDAALSKVVPELKEKAA